VYQRTGQRSEGIANRTTRRRPQEIEAASIRTRYITGVAIERRIFLQIARNEEPTSGLESLSCSLRVIHQALHGAANTAFLSGFLCCGLPRVAPYCAPGGVRVVSGGDGLSLFQHT